VGLDGVSIDPPPGFVLDDDGEGVGGDFILRFGGVGVAAFVEGVGGKDIDVEEEVEEDKGGGGRGEVEAYCIIIVVWGEERRGL